MLVLVGAAAAAGGKAADDFSVPGAESQKAVDLFKAHSPAFAGADAQLVYSVDQGALRDPANRQAIEGALDKVAALPDVETVSDPFAKGGSISDDGRIASVNVRYRVEVTDLETSDGEALEAAARTAETGGVDVAMRGQVIDLASQQDAPIGELIGVGVAIVLLTLLFRSLAAMAATLDRRPDRRGRRPDAARRARPAARAAGLRHDHRRDARPRRRHRLRVAHHRPLPRAGRGGRQRPRRVRQGDGDLRARRWWPPA